MRFSWMLAFAMLGLLGCGATRTWYDEGAPEAVPTGAADPADSPVADSAPPTDASARRVEPASVRAGVGPDFLAFSRRDDTVLARVGDEDLHKSQVFDYMLATFPDKVRAAVSVMLGNRILAAECAKQGISVPESEIEAWYASHVEEVKSQVRNDYGVTMTFERWLELELGQTAHAYEVAASNRERAKRLLSRVIRYHEILEDRVQLRIISTPDRALSEQLRGQIAEGADFATLARRHSVHPSAEKGGLMIPVWRLALNPALDAPAFGLETGELSEVIRVRDQDGADRFQLVKVVQRYQGRPASYASVERDIVASLVAQPLTEDEWYMWQLKVDRMARIRMIGL